jgi:hypothetical protein
MSRPYSVSCHCGALRFEVDADLEEVQECNCSTCGRHGFLHWKVPSAAVRLLSKKRLVSVYKWRDVVGGHEFCPTCGVGLLRSGYPDGIVSLNARCIEGIDLFELRVRRLDGRREMPPGAES